MKVEIWSWCRGFYKICLEDSEKKRQIASWKDCREHCKYFLPDGRLGWDIIFPAKYYNRIAELVGLPLKAKNSKRVEQGKKIGALAVNLRFFKRPLKSPELNYEIEPPLKV